MNICIQVLIKQLGIPVFALVLKIQFYFTYIRFENQTDNKPVLVWVDPHCPRAPDVRTGPCPRCTALH